MRCDRLWTNARLATMRADLPGLGVVEVGAIGMRDGRIAFAGAAADAPDAADVIDCGGRWITPGLIDAHTHLVFAGDRIAEFELRQKGASYEEIARAGGGIASTVAATRAASEAALVQSALPRLDALIAEGVTTIEIKSGYGLTLTDEAKMLRAARALGDARPVTVRTTFLGAHALPGEFVGDADGYIALLCEQILPAIAAEGLADAVDAFCENIGFTPAQTYFLRETKLPPVAALRAAGVPIALATDCNPGTSPLTSLLLTMNMGAVLFGLTTDECLLGVTRHAAQALGLSGSIGTIEAGKRCDLAIWDIERPSDLVGRMGLNPLHQRIWMGQTT